MAWGVLLGAEPIKASLGAPMTPTIDQLEYALRATFPALLWESDGRSITASQKTLAEAVADALADPDAIYAETQHPDGWMERWYPDGRRERQHPPGNNALRKGKRRRS